MKNLFQKLNKPTIAAFLALLSLATLATAGSLTPPGSPSSTMNTLAEVFDSIAGSFDSSGIVADQNGSLIENLKYIEANMGASNSGWTDDGTVVRLTTITDNVGIGTTTPNNRLQVAGLISFDDALANTALGSGALSSNTTGTENTATGWNALPANTTGSQNTAYGYQALLSNATGFNNTAYGYNAGLSALGSGNVFLGYNAGNLDTGSDALYIENSAVASSSALIYGEFDNDYLSFGADVSISRNFEVEGKAAIGNLADINDVFGFLAQTALSVHHEFTDLATFGISAGTAHTYDLNPTGTATDVFFGEDVFVRTNDTNTEDFTGGIVAGRYYPIHLGSGTVSQMDGLQVQPQTDDGTVTQMRGILVSNNTTGTGDIGDAYAIYIDGPLGVGGITNNYGLFVEDQSGATGDSFNIFSAGAGSLNVFEGSVGIASDSPGAQLSVEGNTRLSGHTALGNAGNVDESLTISPTGFTNSSVLALNEIVTSPVTDYVHGVSNDLHANLSAPTAAWFIGQANYVDTLAGSTDGPPLMAGAYNLATNYGDGNITELYGDLGGGSNWGAGTVTNGYGIYTNYCNCVGTGNTTNAYATYGAVHNSSLGTITNAYDFFADVQNGGGIVTNNYGVYVAPQNGLGVVNGYNIFSAGAGTRNIFEGHASVGGNFELTGFVASNLTPTVTDTFDLGTSALRWRNLFANNASLSNNLEVSGIASVSQLFVGGSAFTGVGVTSDSLDFDEFKDAMTLDATTTIASAGFSLGLDTLGYTPTAALSIGRNPMSQGFANGTTAAKLSVVRRMTAVGVPLNAALFQNIWDLPAGGGGGSGVLILNQTASSSAQNMTGQLTGLSAGSENVGTGTATTLLGIQAFAQNRNTGTTTNARGVLASAGSFGGGTVTNGYGIYALPSGTGSTISNMFGLYAARRQAGTTVTVSNWAGLGIEHLTEATNNTGILIASTSSGLNIPAGNFGIYDASPYNNYFAGNVGIGTTTPTTKLDVIGNASVSGTLEIGGLTVNGNLLPGADNAYDLGSSTVRWRDLYLASGSLHIGTAGDEAVIDYNVNDDYLSFKPDGATTRFVISDAGSVGVGTASTSAATGGKVRIVSSATNQPGLRIDPFSSGQTAAGLVLSRLSSTSVANSLPLEFQVNQNGGLGIGRMTIQNIRNASNFDQSTFRVADGTGNRIADMYVNQSGDTVTRWDMYDHKAAQNTLGFRITTGGDTGGAPLTTMTVMENNNFRLGVNGTEGNLITTSATGGSGRMRIITLADIDWDVLNLRPINGPNGTALRGTSDSGVRMFDFIGDGTNGTTAALDLYASGVKKIMLSSGAASVSYFNAGNVGIGTTTPLARMDIAAASGSSGLITYSGPTRALFNATAQGYIDYGSNAFTNLNTGSTGRGAALMGVSEDNSTTDVVANYGFGLSRNATGTRDLIGGIEGDAVHIGAGAINRVNGVLGFARNGGVATVQQLAALYAYPNTNDGGGTVVDNYGLRIEDQAGVGTNNYAIWTEGTAQSVFGGRVGIGATPNDTLDVAGAIEFDIASSSGALNSFALCHNVNGNSSNQELLDCGSLPSADYMEMYPTAHSVHEGDIVMPSDHQVQTTNGQGTVPEMVKANDRNLAIGIISVMANAGDFNSIGYNVPQSARPMPLALVGRVNVAISMENGPITAGDPIALSSTAGVGAKATSAGFIIGRALEPATAAGTLLVYVSPTYWAPSVTEVTGSTPLDGSSWLPATFADLFTHIIGAFKDLLDIEFGEGKVKADVLCAGDVCVNASQLQQLLDTVSTPAPSDEPTPEITPEQTPEETPEITPEVTPEITPEVTPEPTPDEPAETPVPEPETTP